MKKTLLISKLFLASIFAINSQNANSQSCSINTNVNGIAGTGTASNNIGQSFTACGSGTLSTVRVEASNTSVATAKVVIYAGEGTNGTKLGEGAIIQVGSNRTNQWDLNSLNIKVISGQKYTAMFLSASGTPAFTYSTSVQYNYYAGGQIINYGAANNDMFFSATITQLNPTKTPLHQATNVSRNTTLKLQFDRAMQIGTGNIIIKNLTNSTNDTIFPNEVIINSSLVTIPNILPLEKNTQYEVIVPSTTLKATSGISFEGLATTKWNFTTSGLAVTQLSKTATSPTKLTSIPYTISFSEDVTGFDISDLVIANGTATNFMGSGKNYTVNINPTNNGFVKLTIPLGATIEGNELAKDSIYFDNIAPTVNTKNDTVYLDAAGDGLNTIADINNVSTDNYTTTPNLVLSSSKTSFTCADLGNKTVTLYVSDEAGNVGIGTTTVLVLPKKPLMVSKNITVQLGANGSVTITPDDVNNNSVAYCGQTLTLSLSKSTFTCTELGANTINLIGEDSKGNIVSTTATVTVQNKVLPTVITKNITAQLEDSTNTVTITPAMIDNGSTALCGGNLTLSLSKTKFTCSDLGDNTVTLTVTDAQGNVATKTATVTVTHYITDENLTPALTTIPAGTSTTISTNSSMIGVNYLLKNNNGNTQVGTTQSGTGNTLVFNTGNLTSTQTFKVVAEAPTYDGSGALDFDGVNDIVSTNVTTTTTSTLTLEAWIFPRSTNYDRIISNYSSDVNGSIIFDTYNPTADNGKGLRLYLKGATANQTVTAANVLTLNAWNHVAATFNAGAMKLYVNGSLVASATATFTSITGIASKITLGEDATVGTTEYFNGKMDEVRIWTTARTTTEIANNMNTCLTGTETGLKTYFKFSEGVGNTITDLKVGSVGTLTNMDPSTDWVAGKLNCLTNNVCAYQITDLVTINVDNAVGIDNSNINSKVVIAPNPVQNILSISSDLTILKVEVYNILGQLIKTESSSSFDASNLNPGVYLLKINTTNGIAQTRFVKE
ncbi:MAG: hypothetical protein RLZZ175_3 [Bacteroidota bacterium]|jgi:hypothetical protein